MGRAFLWSSVAWAIFAALQAYGIRRQGLNWSAVWAEAPYWSFVWLVWFPAFWALTARKKPDVFFSDLPLGLLPGAQRSLPSVLYVLALPVSAVAGGVVLYLIGEERIREHPWLMIGSFMAGCSISLVACAAAIVRWASRGDPRGRVVTPGPTVALYALAILVSAGVGALVLYLIGEERFREHQRLMIGAFMAGFSISLVACNAAIVGGRRAVRHTLPHDNEMHLTRSALARKRGPLR